MKNTAGFIIYALACVISGFLLFMAGIGAFEDYPAFGFLKLATGIAIYLIGRDIWRALKAF